MVSVGCIYGSRTYLLGVIDGIALRARSLVAVEYGGQQGLETWKEYSAQRKMPNALVRSSEPSLGVPSSPENTECFGKVQQTVAARHVDLC